MNLPSFLGGSVSLPATKEDVTTILDAIAKVDERSSATDTILVLAKLLEPGMTVSAEVVNAANLKIKDLIATL